MSPCQAAEENLLPLPEHQAVQAARQSPDNPGHPVPVQELNIISAKESANNAACLFLRWGF